MRRWPLLLTVVLLAGCGGQSPHHSPSPAPTSSSHSQPVAAVADPGPDLPAVGRSAARAVGAFYSSLSSKDFDSAWARMSNSRRTAVGGYDAWKAGYATTTAIEVADTSGDATDPSHARVSVSMRSTDRDVCDRVVHQRFSGTVTVSRPAGRWVITAADIHQNAGGGTPRTDTATCKTPDTAVDQTASAPASDGTSGPTDDTSGPAATGGAGKVCYPGVDIPAVDIPAMDIPAVTIPAVDIGDQHFPARHLPARHLPGHHLPGRHLAGGCLSVPKAFAPQNTTVLDANYGQLDSGYSPTLTSSYWSSAGDSTRYPDTSAPGFGSYNAAGFPKNQYVRPYIHKDGTMVSGYWRNSPSDGLPTCRIINC